MPVVTEIDHRNETVLEGPIDRKADRESERTARIGRESPRRRGASPEVKCL